MTDTPTPEHIFMSYSRRDEAVMRRVAVFLRKQGINVWVDNEKLVPGTPIWEVEIEKAIKNASAVIVILSPDSKNSEWVRREISLADQYRTRIFPVLVRGDEDSSITIRLITRQYVDIRQDEEIGLSSLSKELSRYLKELEAREQRAREEAERLACEEAERDATEKAVREKADRETTEKIAKEKAEREAAEKAAKEKVEREAAEKAAREKAEREAEEQADREAVEQFIGKPEKTTSIKPVFQKQPFLKRAVIGLIGLCVIATGIWGISYLANLGIATEYPLTSVPTNSPATKPPATKVPEISTTDSPIPDLDLSDLTSPILLEDTLFRTGPGEEHPDWHSFDTGDSVQIIGQTPDRNWLAIIGNFGFIGWVPKNTVYLNDESSISIIQDIEKMKISGRVIDSLGEPVDGQNLAIIMQFNGEEVRMDARSDENGDFYFYVPIEGSGYIGRAGISCNSRIMGSDCRLNGYFPKTASQAINIPQAGSIVFIYEKASIVFTGNIVDSQGNAVGDILVAATRDDGADSWGDSFSNGNFKIPGSYGKWEFYAVKFNPRREGQHVEINVVEGQVFQSITIIAPE